MRHTSVRIFGTAGSSYIDIIRSFLSSWDSLHAGHCKPMRVQDLEKLYGKPLFPSSSAGRLHFKALHVLQDLGITK